jgi:uncharacterized protein YkwD
MIRKQDVRTVGKEVQTVLEFRNQKALYTVVFEQSWIRKQYSWIWNIAVPINDLEGFSSQKETLFSVYIQSVSTEFDIDVLRSKKLIRQQKILLVPASSSTQESTLYLTHAESRYTLSWMSASDTSSIAFLTLPNGSVEKLSLTHSQTKEILPKKTPIEYTFELETPWEYRFELNDASWFAVINIPIYVWNFFPFLPSKHAQYIENGTQDATGIQQKSLDFINTLRNPSSPITLDATLIKLAQAKAEDMAKFNYLWHYDTQGRAIREFWVARGIEIQWLLGENVAGGSWIPYETLLVGLAESGGHRSNMVDVRFKKVWFWAMQSKGSIYYVQVFWE